MISGNHFTSTYVFGKHRKLGQTEINFRVDCKIPLPSRKWISVSILPLNGFQHSKRERESTPLGLAQIVPPPLLRSRRPTTQITCRPNFFFFSLLPQRFFSLLLAIADLAVIDHQPTPHRHHTLEDPSPPFPHRWSTNTQNLPLQCIGRFGRHHRLSIWLPPTTSPLHSTPKPIRSGRRRLHSLRSSLSLNLSLFLPSLTEFVNKRCFYFDFWLC